MSAIAQKKVKEPDIHKVPLSKKEFKRQWLLIAISALYIIYGIFFYYIPIVGWLMAFQNYKIKDGLLGSQFVGFDKFVFLFKDKTFLRVLRNTAAMGVINLVVTTVTAIVFAILLNEVRSKRGKKFIQTVSYLPHFLSWIIVCGIVRDTLSSTGIINELLMKFGLVESAYNFFASKPWFWPIVALSQVWKETGWNAIIYLAAITAIDPALYESASIDGAGRFQKMLYITLPSLMPTIMILLIMNMGNVLNVGFEVQYILGNDVIKSVADTIDIYVLTFGIGKMDFSLGTAAGIFKTVVSFILIFIVNQVSKTTGEDYLF